MGTRKREGGEGERGREEENEKGWYFGICEKNK